MSDNLFHNASTEDEHFASSDWHKDAAKVALNPRKNFMHKLLASLHDSAGLEKSSHEINSVLAHKADHEAGLAREVGDEDAATEHDAKANLHRLVAGCSHNKFLEHMAELHHHYRNNDVYLGEEVDPRVAVYAANIRASGDNAIGKIL
jgi:hypothetical protein